MDQSVSMLPNIGNDFYFPVVVRVSGNQDWKSLKGVKEGLSLRFTIVPTEVDFNENRAVIYCSIFPRSLDGLQTTLDRWNINYIKINLKTLKKGLKDAEEIAEELYNYIGRQEDLEEAIAKFGQENELSLSEEDLAKKWMRMKMTDATDKIPTIPLKDENEPTIYGKKIRLGIEENEVLHCNTLTI